MNIHSPRAAVLVWRSVVNNPIFTQQARQQMRKRWSLIITFGYAAMLTGIFLIAFFMMWEMEDEGTNFALTSGQLAKIGSALFSILVFLQAAVLTIYMPSLTGGFLPREREKQTLELLLVAPLLPWQVILGQILFAGALAALLLVIALPLQAVTVIMGGVPWAEVVAVNILLWAGGMVSSAIGLVVSSLGQRSTTTISAAVLVSFAFNMVSLQMYLGMQWISPNNATLVAILNPYIAIPALLDSRFDGTLMTAGVLLKFAPVLVTSLGFVWVASVVAARRLHGNICAPFAVWQYSALVVAALGWYTFLLWGRFGDERISALYWTGVAVLIACGSMMAMYVFGRQIHAGFPPPRGWLGRLECGTLHLPLLIAVAVVVEILAMRYGAGSGLPPVESASVAYIFCAPLFFQYALMVFLRTFVPHRMTALVIYGITLFGIWVLPFIVMLMAMFIHADAGWFPFWGYVSLFCLLSMVVSGASVVSSNLTATLDLASMVCVAQYVLGLFLLGVSLARGSRRRHRNSAAADATQELRLS